MKYAYDVQDVSFENKFAGITLAGTLTIPNGVGPFPAVVLISGMGPADRDCNLMQHKLFLVLAEYLTKRGIAVLRYDKRGICKSTGTFDLTVTSEDLAGDVVAGVQFLKTRKEINTKKIGLIGTSEGGIIAPMVAAESKEIAFIVLLVAASATNVEHILEQVALQLCADGASDVLITKDCEMRRQLLTIVKQETNYERAEKQLRAVVSHYLNDLPENYKTESEKYLFSITKVNVDEVLKFFNSPWHRYYLAHNPADTLKKIKIPVLAISGGLDFIAYSRIVLPLIAQALKEAGNTDFTTIEVPNMNHWLQACKTGAMAEYGATKETIVPIVLTTVADWIMAHTVDRKQVQ